MFRALALPKGLLLYGACVPIALWLGYLLATPDSFGSIVPVALFLLALSFPLWLRWHYPILLFTWHSWFVASFLPGQPNFGIVMALFVVGLVALNRTVRGRTDYISVPSVVMPLLFLTAVVFVTAQITGGIGARAFGSGMWGAKRYLGVFGAIAGYFALASCRIPPEKRALYTGLFLLGGTTSLVSDLIFLGGSSMYFLLALFYVSSTWEFGSSPDAFVRLGGFGNAGITAFYFLLARYGLRGLLDLTKVWRLLLGIALVAVCLLGGYRSFVILLFLTLVVQFYFEGLFRTRLLPLLVLVFVLSGVFLVTFVERLPLTVQRSLSFLPLNVDATARRDAEGTAEWRFEMWKAVIPDIPKYFWVGKGFTFNGTDYWITLQAVTRNMLGSFEHTLISGNYHNGILTTIIPFGIFGFLGLLWFSGAGFMVLYRNYRYGEQSMKLINTFLLTAFTSRLVFYLTVYGQFDMEFVLLTGYVGFSVALNHGVRTRKDVETATEPALGFAHPRLLPV